MLIEAHQDFLVELRGSEGGLSVLPSPSGMPKKHRFQGGLNYSRMIEIDGRVLAPSNFGDRQMRIWLSQLQEWDFDKHRPAYIGEIYDRTGELPGGGLEATMRIPKDAWLTAVECLNTIWRRLSFTAVDGDGNRMTIIAFSFSSSGCGPA
jgi:hypothetical protein